MNPNQISQNTKRKFSWIAQPNSVPYSDENGDFDSSWVNKFKDNSKQDKNLVFTNVVVDNWESDSTYTNFSYKCEISNLTGVTSSMTALVIFNPDDNINNDYANICLTGTDSVTIYSKLNSTITVPKIIVFK